jgi:hypothetical protein
MHSQQTSQFVKLMQKASAELDKDLGVRQSARYREDVLPAANAKTKAKKPRRFRCEIPEGKRGQTIFEVIACIKQLQQVDNASNDTVRSSSPEPTE